MRPRRLASRDLCDPIRFRAHIQRFQDDDRARAARRHHRSHAGNKHSRDHSGAPRLRHPAGDREAPRRNLGADAPPPRGRSQQGHAPHGILQPAVHPRSRSGSGVDCRGRSSAVAPSRGRKDAALCAPRTRLCRSDGRSPRRCRVILHGTSAARGRLPGHPQALKVYSSTTHHSRSAPAEARRSSSRPTSVPPKRPSSCRARDSRYRSTAPVAGCAFSRRGGRFFRGSRPPTLQPSTSAVPSMKLRPFSPHSTKEENSRQISESRSYPC